MQIAGICSICGRQAKPAHTCILCGAIVCGRCYDLRSGTCKNCSMKR